MKVGIQWTYMPTIGSENQQIPLVMGRVTNKIWGKHWVWVSHSELSDCFKMISDRDLVLEFTFTRPSTKEGYFPQFILDPPRSENICMNWSMRVSVSNKMSRTLTHNFAWNRNWLYDFIKWKKTLVLISYFSSIPSDSLLLILRSWLPPTLVLTTVLPTLLRYPINVAQITLLPLVLASLLVLRHRRRRVLRRRLLSRVCCRTARPSRPVSFLKITFDWIRPFSGPFSPFLTWDIFVGAFLPGGTLPH